MNKKKENVKPKTNQEGWFARNKTIFAVIICTIILVLVILGAAWYFSTKISSLTLSLQKSEQRIENLEEKITAILEEQQEILANVNEINNRLTESILPPVGEQSKIKSESKKALKSIKEKTEKETEVSSKTSWLLPIVIILIIVIVVAGYFILKRFRKEESLRSY